jgi:S-adenosylmethionine:tRNA ribosyltransferase-isomerase
MPSEPAIPLSEFQYELPDRYIAHEPLERGRSRLLVYRSGRIEHARFTDISDKLPQESLLVFNQSKVIPARIRTVTSQGKPVEIFLLKPAGSSADPVQVLNQNESVIWECMIGRRKDWKADETLLLNSHGIVIKAFWHEREQNQVKFQWTPAHIPFAQVLEAVGKIPLPPYIQREAKETDKTFYQTVYAKSEGSVAAPTAGLHFTDKILENIRQKGHDTAFVTLHVGAGTFMPVKEENMLKHVMHSELITVSLDFIEKLTRHQGPLIPVGTTSLRVLESLWHLGADDEELSRVVQFPGTARKTFTMQESMKRLGEKMRQRGMDSLTAETSIMIYPGYTLHACDALITNFHQPGSTLLMLVAALIGDDWKRVYEEAKNENYRFLSYGDSSLLFRKK